MHSFPVNMANSTAESVDTTKVTDDNADSSHSADKLRAARTIINRTVPVLLLVLGTFGNTMPLVLFCKRKLSAFNIFFIVLAVSDMCVLYTGPLLTFIHSVADFKIKGKSIVVCKLPNVIVDISAVLSAWTVVAMTSQRAASVIWPHRVKQVCTTRNASIYVTCLSVFSFVFLSHHIRQRYYKSQQHVYMHYGGDTPPPLPQLTISSERRYGLL